MLPIYFLFLGWVEIFTECIDIHIKFYICLRVTFYVVFEKDKCLSRFHICFISMSVHQVRKLAIMIQNYCWEGSLLANLLKMPHRKLEKNAVWMQQASLQPQVSWWLCKYPSARPGWGRDLLWGADGGDRVAECYPGPVSADWLNDKVVVEKWKTTSGFDTRGVTLAEASVSFTKCLCRNH